jgi:hypothetical protein
LRERCRTDPFLVKDVELLKCRMKKKTWED